jgi:hypothetical protein
VVRLVVVTALAGCSFRGPLIGDAAAIDAPAIDATDSILPDASDDAAIDTVGGVIDAAHDASPDASPDALACPSSYTLAIGASRYRVISVDTTIGVHDMECNADQPGRTHLVAFDTLAEMTTLQPMLGIAPPSGQWFVGNVQQANQATPSTGWLLITGGPLPGGLWAPGQPDDLGGAVGEDNTQNISSVQADGLHDNSATITGGAVCECDGKPPDPTASALIP